MRRYVSLLLCMAFLLTLSACGAKSAGTAQETAAAPAEAEAPAENRPETSATAAEPAPAEAAATPEPTPTPVPLERVPSAVTYADLPMPVLNPNEPNEIMVVLISFKDGYQVDRKAFEKLFTGDYGDNMYLRSVSSYYRYNSYGKDLFRFHFYYYDSPMTSKEVYDYVTKTKSRFPPANTLVYDAFEALKEQYPEEINGLDTDGDGYFPACYFVTAENVSYLPEPLFYGSTADSTYIGVPGDVGFRRFVKISYERFTAKLQPAVQAGYTRQLVHETGHLFGIEDYYDFHDYEGSLLDVTGGLDMHSRDMGDENVFSKFAAGWLNPYYVSPDVESVTVTIGNSSLHNDAILIPTSAGWNGTAFDEYVLVDVIGRFGANGYDWNVYANEEGHYPAPHKNDRGGVRVYHVDARLVGRDRTSSSAWYAIEDPAKLPASCKFVTTRFTVSNGCDPYLKGDNRFFHCIELIPSDGSSKIRISEPAAWGPRKDFRSGDLFGPGDVFSMKTCADAFPNAPYMNTGAIFDYEVRVDAFDPAVGEATVTVTRVR